MASRDHKSAHVEQTYLDICGFCGKNLKPRYDIAWQGMTTPEGAAAAANYCPQSRTDKLDPNKKGRPSRCETLGLMNPRAVAARLKKYKAACDAAEAQRYGTMA